jgi:hypothetical protein
MKEICNRLLTFRGQAPEPRISMECEVAWFPIDNVTAVSRIGVRLAGPEALQLTLFTPSQS